MDLLKIIKNKFSKLKKLNATNSTQQVSKIEQQDEKQDLNKDLTTEKSSSTQQVLKIEQQDEKQDLNKNLTTEKLFLISDENNNLENNTAPSDNLTNQNIENYSKIDKTYEKVDDNSKNDELQTHLNKNNHDVVEPDTEIEEDDEKKYILLEGEENTLQHVYIDPTTNEQRTVTLHRIQYCKDINEKTKKGTLGGWLESENNLSQNGFCIVRKNAKVWGNAKILDDAVVSDNACVFDDAMVFQDAYVTNDAQIFNKAFVLGFSKITNSAKIYNYAFINGNSHIKNNTQIKGCAILEGSIQVEDNAIIKDNAKVTGNVKITNNVVISDNAEINGNTKSSIQIYDEVKIGGKTKLKGLISLAGKIQLNLDIDEEIVLYYQNTTIRSFSTFQYFYNLNKKQLEIPSNFKFNYTNRFGYEKI